MTNFEFMPKDTKLQIAKNKNIGAGFLLGNLDFIIGNNKILIAEAPQFTIVEYGKNSGLTISGIYIQTIGPKLKPKLII